MRPGRFYIVWVRGDSRKDRYANRLRFGLLPSGRRVRSYRLGNRCGVRRWGVHSQGARPKGDRSGTEILTQQTRPDVLLGFPNPR